MTDKLGPFELKDVIGQGGMGTVYRAFDPLNNRIVALKVIKETLLKSQKAKKRFLNEAHIQAQLSHPSIIPIFGLEQHKEGLGYSMPFVQGCTLKTLMLKWRDNQNVMPLKERLRHFMKVLEALDYVHDKGFIHRDIKADNIFIGIHNDTYLFDWGLACTQTDQDLKDDSEYEESEELTRPGKIPGTLTHLAPERAHGAKGSIQTDIFSLGVVLYQLLTLKMPFYRKDLEHFKKVASSESFVLPSLLNIKDDIDEALDVIIQRALAQDPSRRYTSVKIFIEDLQKVLDGQPVWKDPQNLTLQDPSCWHFQDLLPLGSYLALSQKSLSWGLLSVPKMKLYDNYKLVIKAKVTADFKIYLNLIPTISGFDLENCYIIHIRKDCLISLNRCDACLDQTTLFYDQHKDLDIVVENIENHFKIYSQSKLLFEFSLRLPSIAPYVGLMIEDTEFSFSSIEIFQASSAKHVSCLKLGDHLIGHGLFDLAIGEYEKITKSFHDHLEGQEALFRMGYTHILHSRQSLKPSKKRLNQAIETFEMFKTHKASPWEYWGKALCYKELGLMDEVTKCFELGFRKYPKHVFTKELKEELIVLFSQKSREDKKLALKLAFIALRHLDDSSFYDRYPSMIESLKDELSSVLSILDPLDLSPKQQLILSLAFVLKQDLFLNEILTKSDSASEKINALLILQHLGQFKISKSSMSRLEAQCGFTKQSLDSFQNPLEPPYRLARLSSDLLQKKISLPLADETSQALFLKGLQELIVYKTFDPDKNYDQNDKYLLIAMKDGISRDKSHLIKLLKSSKFQDSEHFVRSNFLIGLLDRKPLDYFGYDKICLEFAIKALF